MRIKTYQTPQNSRYIILANVKGKEERIVFTGGNLSQLRGATFVTTDVDIQDYIESLRDFKNGTITLLSVEDSCVATEQEEESPSIVQKEVKIRPMVVNKTEEEDGCVAFDSVKDLQSMLIKDHKVSFSEIRSYQNAMAKAKELGLKCRVKGYNDNE